MRGRRYWWPVDDADGRGRPRGRVPADFADRRREGLRTEERRRIMNKEGRMMKEELAEDR